MSDEINTQYEHNDTPKTLVLKHEINRLRAELQRAQHYAGPEMENYRSRFSPIADLSCGPSTEHRFVMVEAAHSLIKIDPSTGRLHCIAKAGRDIRDGISFSYVIDTNAILQRDDWAIVLHELIKRCAVELSCWLRGRGEDNG